MITTEAMWLRGQAAQRDVLHLVAYGTAFVGTASVQALTLGLTAPRSYWAALGRAAAVQPPSRSDSSYSGSSRKPSGEVEAIAPPALTTSATRPTVQAAPTPAAAPLAATTPSLSGLEARRGESADDLTLLKGVGPKLAAALNGVGIYQFDQIAALDEAGIAAIEARQKGFRMICARHDIVTQARTLT